MSLCLKLAGLPSPWSPSHFSSSSSSNNLGSNTFSYLGLHGVSPPSSSAMPKLSNQNPFRHFCSLHSDDINVHSWSDSGSLSPEQEGSAENKASGQGVQPKSNEIIDKLRRYGIAGLLSYGLLNTAYYSTTFLLVWFYVSPAPGKMGYLAAVERFVKVMAMVWAGSQVTKILRAGGALALAPFVDKALSWFAAEFKFNSQGQAFMAIVAFCFGLAVLLFFSVTLLSA